MLFVDADLSAVLADQEARMLAEIDAIPQKDILQLNLEEVCDYYESEFTVEVPSIDPSFISVEQAETAVDVSQERGRDIRDRSRPFHVIGTSVTYFVPFQGDANLFRCSPSSTSSNPPRASVGQGELTLTYARTDQNADRIAADFESRRQVGTNRAGPRSVAPLVSSLSGKLMRGRSSGQTRVAA